MKIVYYPSLDDVAQIAGLSKFHFHRQFMAEFGVSLAAMQRLIRLRRAAWQLAFRKELSVLDVAIQAGYNSAEAFSRAFSMYGGQTPSAFRSQPDWPRWESLSEPLALLQVTAPCHSEQLETVILPHTPVALLMHRGAPNQVMHSVARFIEWRKVHGLPPSKSRTFNIFYTDTREAPASDFCFGIAASGVKQVAPNELGVTLSAIPALTCLSCVIEGEDMHLQAKVLRILASCEEQLDLSLFPPFIERLQLYPDVAAHEAQVRLYLPVSAA